MIAQILVSLSVLLLWPSTSYAQPVASNITIIAAPAAAERVTSPEDLPRIGNSTVLAQIEEQAKAKVGKATDSFIAGELPVQPTECWFIPLTDYAVCVDIWIEDRSPGPG